MTSNPAALSAAFALKRAITWAVLCFVVSRLALSAVGLITFAVSDDFDLHSVADYAAAWVDMLAHWDSYWFLSIARDGYWTEPLTQADAAGQANWAFFPLYPVVGGAVAWASGMPSSIALVVVANLCFVVALVLVQWEA